MQYFMFPIALLSALVLNVSAPPAHAQSRTQLTDSAVHSFYSEIPGLFQKPLPAFLDAYAQRLHPDLTYRAQTFLVEPGGITREGQPVQATRDDLVNNASQAYQAAKGATLSNSIRSITITPDGQHATVRHVSSIRNMTMMGPNNRKTKAHSRETCSDDLVLNNGMIQVLNSTCDTQLEFAP